MKHIASLAGAALALSLVAAPAIAAPHGGNQAQQQNQGAWNNHRNDNRGDARRSGPRREAQNDNRGNRNWRGNNGGNWQNQGNDNRNRNRAQQRRNPNAHANWRDFRRNIRSPQRFRVVRYRAPASYNYRRWSYGQHLPFEYRARHFWLTNFFAYGLFPPPPGLVWVRYGDDALLIDAYTGEIVQVRYDVFYW